MNASPRSADPATRAPLSGATAIVTTCEVNRRHGTGAQIMRVVANTPNVLSIRSLTLYGGDCDLGEVSLCVSQAGRSRAEAARNAASALGEHTISRVLCVPYIGDDLVTALALREHGRCRLAAYIMDDQNIWVPGIPDDLMGEFLGQCSLRLTTCPELAEAYEAKYGRRLGLLPALVSHELLAPAPGLSDRAPHSSEAGVLIGSLGNRRCFDQLCATISSAGVALDWYNGSVHDYDHTTQYHGLRDDPERRRQVMIRPCGLLPEDQLAETVRTYPYALIPTGALDESGDDNPRLWRLSFAVAAANLPVIVLGSETTSAARFVRQFEVGVICDYRGDRLRDAIARVTDIETRRRMRRHAAAVGPRFSARGVNAWLWASLDLDRPRDLRFEELLPRPPASPPPGQRVDARGVP